MGRPKNIEPTIPIAVRVPTAMMLAMDMACRDAGQSRSDWLKGAINSRLASKAGQLVPMRREDGKIFVQLTQGDWTAVEDLPNNSLSEPSQRG